MLCRHCQRCSASRPRALCWNCYRHLEIRLAYPPTNDHGRRGEGLAVGRRPRLPPHPTGANPGTPEKIAIMRERARQGFELFHPLDGAETLDDFLGHAG